jgi:type IV pilus assembly protein PilB
MNIDNKNIKDILIAGNYISEEDAKKAEDIAKAGSITFIDALLRDGIVNSDIVGQATAESFKVPYSDLNSAAISADQVRKIPEDVAKKLRVVLFNEDDEKEIIITTNNPLQEGIVKELQPLFKDKKIKITYSLPEDIDSFFVFYETQSSLRIAN